MNDLVYIGIVGYGKLGQFLVNQVLANGVQRGIRLAFVWNRSKDTAPLNDLLLKHKSNPAAFGENFQILNKLNELNIFNSKLDLIVEVCHPTIVQEYGLLMLDYADLLIGSPTALADQRCFEKLRQKLSTSNASNQLFVARGALWGADDIQSLAQCGLLEKVEITMNFHPHALRLADQQLKLINDQTGSDGCVTLYHGPVRKLCRLAPNNVNTMATAALVGVGFDRTIGKLVSNATLGDYHRVEIAIKGKPTVTESKSVCFKVSTIRQSPTGRSVDVTSSQTFVTFWNSVLKCADNRRRQLSPSSRNYRLTQFVDVC